METDTPDLAKWDFAEVEYILRRHAASIGSAYDERKPLAYIGDHAGKRALDGLGLTVKQIHPYSGFEYATVTGWFRAGRVPSSSTFKTGIFPTLCEAYVRLHEQDAQHRSARDAYVNGGDMDEGYRLAVERKVATLFCTGMLTTREERIREYERNRESFHRAVMRLASVYLDGHELNSLADVTLGMLKAHAARHALEAETSADRLSEVMSQTQWYWHADQQGDLASLLDGTDSEQVKIFAEASPRICASFMEGHTMDGFLETLSDDVLIVIQASIQAAMEERGLA